VEVLEVTDRHSPSEIIRELLRLETRPVGVLLLESEDCLPRRPLPFKVNICQLISMARHQGRAASGVPGSMVCAIGAACTGLIDTPPQFLDGTAAVGRYTADAEAGRRFFANTFMLSGTGTRFAAVHLAPLDSWEGAEPQVVVIYGNPAQMMRLVHACTYSSGEKVAADTVAEAAVCSAIGFAVSTGRPVLGLPCAGDRRFGGTQNHEMVFCTPSGLMEDLASALLDLSLQGPLYPVPPNVMWTPQMPVPYTIRDGGGS
jgi:uncharacterized protein (DUF169 family)